MTMTETAAPSCTAGPTDLPLLRQTLSQNLDETAARHPEAPAVIECGPDGTPEGGRTWTFAQLRAESVRVAKALIAAGYAPGDRLGMWSPNVAEWTTLLYGAARAGVILVNLNPVYRSHELTYVVEQCDMAGLVVACPDERMDPPTTARRVAQEGAPALRQLIMLPTPGRIGADSYPHARPDTVPGKAAEAQVQELTWSTLLAGADQVSDAQLAEREAQVHHDDPVNLQYTSGTTGFPKGVTLSHVNILNNGFHIGELLGYTADDVLVIPVPFFHCFGMVIGTMAAVSHGTAQVLPSRGFDPAKTLAAAAATRATSLYGVPTMFISMLAREEARTLDLSRLRTGVMAGSTCPVEVMKQVIDELNMTEVAICYGMTETAPVSTMTRRDDSLARRTETVGRSMPHVETKIVDPSTGEVVPRGATGELCTRGYCVMSGYWDDEQRTAAVLDEHGWMHSGDLASMDEDGYVRIEGRIKDLIIRGGENISPREVEEFLYTHPDIQDVQVVGVPDDKYGEQLLACVILREGAEPLTAEDIKEFSTGRIAHFKVPAYVQVRDAFPMTVSGKVRKVELREQGRDYVAALG
ncbi:fatty-acyl-CoA synthase [Micrococcus cohnii]|uniref:Fatty-acyl-CoA synthase n=2 Tax=Micrococcus cohnii TaxID=993416 RepID=A0A7W7GP82_9MICC|nr:fatty-acyl-CoA synthase [Micrococcus cohnii]